MATQRFEAEKFSGKNDFGLWRIKKNALLIQQGFVDALTIDPAAKGEDEEASTKRKEMLDKAHSAIILSLRDNVLRDVSKEESAYAIWTKLEKLYMTKSLANRLYMKQKLYSYRLRDDKPLVEELDDFNKTVDDFENTHVKLEDEDKAIIFLNALPKSYEHLKDAMLNGREKTITLDEVQNALKTKELAKQNNGYKDLASEALNVKGFKGKKS